MNYDNWKLSNGQDDGWNSDEVTSCCGKEQHIKESLAHDDKVYYCSECGETDNWYTLMEEYEYEEMMEEDANEIDRDE
tara:strand:+ start:334 stop:567 length:234 start_codon:yes stop_codon:yes gene_type:complete